MFGRGGLLRDMLGPEADPAHADSVRGARSLRALVAHDHRVGDDLAVARRPATDGDLGRDPERARTEASPDDGELEQEEEKRMKDCRTIPPTVTRTVTTKAEGDNSVRKRAEQENQ